MQSTTWELVEIQDEHKGLVIGKRGARLQEISAQSGANVIRMDGQVYITLGTEDQRKLAKLHIGDIVVGSCYFIRLPFLSSFWLSGHF